MKSSRVLEKERNEAINRISVAMDNENLQRLNAQSVHSPVFSTISSIGTKKRWAGKNIDNFAPVTASSLLSEDLKKVQSAPRKTRRTAATLTLVLGNTAKYGGLLKEACSIKFEDL